MKDGFFNGKAKYLLLLPLALLIAILAFTQYSAQKVEETVRAEKYEEIVNEINMLAAAVDANPERYWLDHEQNIIASVSYLNHPPYALCAVYKTDGGGHTLITSPGEAAPFTLPDYQSLPIAVEQQDSGDIVIAGVRDRDLHLYFRWMPRYSPDDERYLVVAGVRETSIPSMLPMWVSAGQIASVLITFCLNAILVVILAYLGHIYSLRSADKHRDRRPPHV